MPTFNLLDNGWIPCLRRGSDPPALLSIREVFHQASEIQQISDPAPTVTIMLHRLLLAILHRSLNGPQSTDEWAAIWRAGQWDLARIDTIDAYLARVHDRFDLFDPVHPFYQTTGLAAKAFNEINQLTHERASARNRPLLFDHSLPGGGLAPDLAARYLIAQQGFSVGGMFSTNPGEGSAEKFASGSPLLTSAVCLAVGDNLFQTLMLNWVQYNRSAEQPFPFAGDDKPAWERDEPVTPTERRPDGWVDLLTWQCRRIALQAELRDNRRLVVTRAALMQGYRLPPSFEVRQAETMVGYTLLKDAKTDRSPWVPVGLNPGKAVWRDSHALFQSIVGEQQRPRVLEWLRKLIAEGRLYPEKRPKTLPLNVYGIMPDQARIEDWRAETLSLPPLLLEEPARADRIADIIRRELTFAEHAARLLEPYTVPVAPQGKRKATRDPSPVRVLAEELLRSTADRKPDPKAAAALGRHLSPVENYWAALESPFRVFILALSDDLSTDSFGDLAERGAAARTWAASINRIVRSCFDEMTSGLENSGRSLRATALARQQFSQTLARLNAAHDALLPEQPPEQTQPSDPASEPSERKEEPLVR